MHYRLKTFFKKVLNVHDAFLFSLHSHQKIPPRQIIQPRLALSVLIPKRMGTKNNLRRKPRKKLKIQKPPQVITQGNRLQLSPAPSAVKKVTLVATAQNTTR